MSDEPREDSDAHEEPGDWPVDEEGERPAVGPDLPTVDAGAEGSPDEPTPETADDPVSGDRSGEPLGELAASVADRREREDETSAFTEVDVPEIDADAVWEQLDADDPVGSPESGGPSERVVEKDAYCESCPYFSEPPAVACTHEGTEIAELVGVDRFRVLNCPKVREDEQLERI